LLNKKKRAACELIIRGHLGRTFTKISEDMSGHVRTKFMRDALGFYILRIYDGNVLVCIPIP